MSELGNFIKKKSGEQAWDDETGFVPVGLSGLLAASSRLLAVNRGLAEPDERDHLAFKQLLDVPALVRERIRIDEGKKRRSLLRFTTRARTLQHWHANALGAPIRGQFVGNELSADTEQTNPMLGIEQLRRVTQMGPGGIGSSNAITEDMVALNASTFGFLSAIEGPESETIGIDTRLAVGTRFGSDGRIYQQFRNRKTGEVEYASPADLIQHTLKLPD